MSRFCQNDTMHPPAYMVDGDTNTWWQSASRVILVGLGYGRTITTPESVIDIDLEQVPICHLMHKNPCHYLFQICDNLII